MKIKMFVTDMDGTLLNAAHRISAANKQALQKAAEQGILVTIATGRMYLSALPYAKELGLDVPIITYNGALIKSVSGKVFHTDYLPAGDVRAVLKYCYEKNWHVHLYSEDALYFAAESEESKAYEALAGVSGSVVGKEGLFAHVDEVPKMLVTTSGATESDAAAAELNQVFGERIFAVKSNPEYVEIVRRGVNKATALEKLAKNLGISLTEVAAIGDSNNDLPMLQAAGMAIAMGNANEEVKNACHKATDDCEHDGVAKAMETYILQA